MGKKSNSLLYPSIVATFILLVAVMMAPASAASTPQQLPPSVAKGLGVKWWQWAFSFSSKESPLTDLKGTRCDKGDLGNVFFLAGIAGPTASSGDPVKRVCNVPISRNQLILIPILNAACLLKTPCANPNEPVNDIKKMQNELKGLVDAVGRTKAVVDWY